MSLSYTYSFKSDQFTWNHMYGEFSRDSCFKPNTYDTIYVESTETGITKRFTFDDAEGYFISRYKSQIIYLIFS